MVDWAHGYDVSVGYTYGFYREMAPDWLDFCTRIAGFVPPRRGPSGQFRYLDLGTGQGLGLCLMAAAYPEAEFLGIDFHPEHIAHAESLASAAGLTNVRFVEADFIDLADHWPDDFGLFDYVVLHGIYSWIPPHVREAIIGCLSKATRPGAIVYNSFNTQPGWLGSVAFQHIALRIKEVTGKPGKAVIDESIGLFEKLAENDALLFKAIPSVKARVDRVKKQDSSYAIQEYLNQSWTPFWHSQVVNDLARAKLGYVGPATIAETQLPAMLTAPMREIIASQPSDSLQQDLQDIAINQTFRRDIYCRGARRSVGSDWLNHVYLHLIAEPAPGPIEVKTSYGTRKIEVAGYAEIVEALRAGPKSIGDIAGLPSVQPKGKAALLRVLALLIQSHTLMVGGGAATDDTVSHRLNAAVARARAQGAPYRFLATARLGSAIAVKSLDLLLIDAWFSFSGQADAAKLVRAVTHRMAAMGLKLQHEGKAATGAEAEQRIGLAVEKFIQSDLPQWQRLGALP